MLPRCDCGGSRGCCRVSLHPCIVFLLLRVSPHVQASLSTQHTSLTEHHTTITTRLETELKEVRESLHLARLEHTRKVAEAESAQTQLERDVRVVLFSLLLCRVNRCRL